MIADLFSDGEEKAEICGKCKSLIKYGSPCNYCKADGRITFLVDMDIDIIKLCAKSDEKTPQMILREKEEGEHASGN